MSEKKVLKRALHAIHFEPGELAYLALTSKLELPVRDRLAWALTKARLRVAREWRRCDLAILDGGGMPLALVELKATHTGDVKWGGHATFAAAHGGATYLDGLIRADAAKARALAPTAEVFVLVVVTHVADPVPRALDEWVKYPGQLRKVADQQEAERMLDGYLARLGPVERVPLLERGEALGLGVRVDAWLCGPVCKAKPAAAEPIGASMTWSDLIEQLTGGFELRTNRDKKYGPIYDDGRRIGLAQLLKDGAERLWLLEPNAASERRFTITRSQTWKGGHCEVTKETVEACRRALKLAAAVRRPGAT